MLRISRTVWQLLKPTHGEKSFSNRPTAHSPNCTARSTKCFLPASRLRKNDVKRPYSGACEPGVSRPCGLDRVSGSTWRAADAARPASCRLRHEPPQPAQAVDGQAQGTQSA